jgi:penicillin-insensitive murein endopeptidase
MRSSPLLLAIVAFATSSCGAADARPPSVLPAEAAAPIAAREPSESAALSAPAPVQAAPEPDVKAQASTSIGSPTNGALQHGAALPLRGDGFHFNDRRSSDARHGTDEVVAAIRRAAQRVHAELPGSELVVNDLSLPKGGPIPHHGSHRAGRDADILFYLNDRNGAPTGAVGAPLDPAGIGIDFKDLSVSEDDVEVRLDAARTWHFVAALLEDPQAVVQRIFVVEHVRTLLLAAARSAGAPGPIVTRFEEVSCQPSYPHDDHLHVRWFCSAEDITAGCEEAAPLYPWHLSALKAKGVTPVLAKLKKAAEPADVVTQAEAAQAVQAASPHAAVLAFLERRKAWERQPHPGRLYCR